MEKKVLVCITIQENSRRLISEGVNVIKPAKSGLHILHIRKGETIFDNPESSDLLENLFAYGSLLGGEVHFLCSNDVIKCITDFIIDYKITHLVLGETTAPINDGSTLGVYEQLAKHLPHVQISVLSREDCLENPMLRSL